MRLRIFLQVTRVWWVRGAVRAHLLPSAHLGSPNQFLLATPTAMYRETRRAATVVAAAALCTLLPVVDSQVFQVQNCSLLSSTAYDKYSASEAVEVGVLTFDPASKSPELTPTPNCVGCATRERAWFTNVGANLSNRSGIRRARQCR